LIRNAAGEELQVSLAAVLGRTAVEGGTAAQPEPPRASVAGEGQHEKGETVRQAYVRGLAREAAHALGLSA
jgi:hypothetical protein